MTSQSNASRSGQPRLVFTNDGPRINAVDTLQAVWDELVVTSSFALIDLFTSEPGSSWFIAPASTEDTDAEGPATAIPERARRLANLAPSRIAATATAAGCETTVRRLWADEVGKTFASEPRLIEVLHVATTWQFIRIAAPQAETAIPILYREVEAGDYLILSAGLNPQVKAICRIDRVPTSDELAAISGFAADRISARCGRCHRQWTASDGQDVFTETTGAAGSWRFDPHADLGLVTATVPCPAPGCTGRITFSAADG